MHIGGIMCNFSLLKAIRDNNLSQKEFARLVGDHETLVSRVVRGHWNLDEERKLRYAKVLKKKPSELFG